MPNLIIGSRGSKLALWQAEWVKTELESIHDGLTVEIEIIRTTGDKLTEASLARMPGKGAFTKEIEEALFERRIDLAVHSLKDLPTVLPEGLHVAAIPEREDPRDALIVSRRHNESVNSIESLPQNARIGTSSPRRAAQLKLLRPDLQIFELRGNVETRLRKLEEDGFDAIILAAAGLRRLGFAASITQMIPVDELLPAVGQGALGIETCVEDERTNYLLERLNHWPTRNAVEAERAVLRGLGGGCAVPVAAYARLESVTETISLRLDALVCDAEGTRVVRHTVAGSQYKSEELGGLVARHLIAAGAYELLNAKSVVHPGPVAPAAPEPGFPGDSRPTVGSAGDEQPSLPGFVSASEETEPASTSSKVPAAQPAAVAVRPLAGTRILITRSRNQADNLARGLEELGAEVVVCPTIEIRPPESWAAVDQAIASLSDYDWLAFTSVNGVNGFLQRYDELKASRSKLAALKICAVGERTAARLQEEKLKVDLTPQKFSAENLVAAFIKKYGVGQRIRGARMLLPAARSTRDVIRPSLEKVGVSVDIVEAYRNLLPDVAHEAVQSLVREANADYIIFTSPSTVNNLAVLLDTDDLLGRFAKARIACIGPVTAEAVERFGLKVAIQPEEQTMRALVEEIIRERR